MPAKTTKKTVAAIATEPTSHDISTLLPSVTSFTTEDDRIKRAKMLWYKINGKETPLDLFLSADLSVDEYQDYIEKIIGDYQPTLAPAYSLQDIASRAFNGVKKRTITTNLKNYCSAHDIDYKALKARKFDAYEAEALRKKLVKEEYPKSKTKSAEKAGKISASVKYALNHADEFEQYLERTHKDKKKTHDQLLLLWSMKRDKQPAFQEKSQKDKEFLYGAMESFRKEK